MFNRCGRLDFLEFCAAGILDTPSSIFIFIQFSLIASVFCSRANWMSMRDVFEPDIILKRMKNMLVRAEGRENRKRYRNNCFWSYCSINLVGLLCPCCVNRNEHESSNIGDKCPRLMKTWANACITICVADLIQLEKFNFAVICRQIRISALRKIIACQRQGSACYSYDAICRSGWKFSGQTYIRH